MSFFTKILGIGEQDYTQSRLSDADSVELYEEDKHRPIVIKQDGREAESCYEVCNNMGVCNKCDSEF